MIDILLVFVVGVAGSFISATSGVGVGLFTAYLMLTGIPAPVAVGTGRLGGLVTNISAMTRFFKSGHIKWSYVLGLSIVSLVSGLIGSFVLVSLPVAHVELIIGFIFIIVGIISLLKRGGMESQITSIYSKIIGWVCVFFSVIASSAFGAGIGSLATFVYLHFFGFSAIEASATRRLPSMVGSTVSFTVFVIYGLVNFRLGIFLALGTILGGYLGAHIAIKKGNDYVKIVLTVVMISLGLRFILS